MVQRTIAGTVFGMALFACLLAGCSRHKAPALFAACSPILEVPAARRSSTLTAAQAVALAESSSLGTVLVDGNVRVKSLGDWAPDVEVVAVASKEGLGADGRASKWQVSVQSRSRKLFMNCDVPYPDMRSIHCWPAVAIERLDRPKTKPFFEPLPRGFADSPMIAASCGSCGRAIDRMILSNTPLNPPDWQVERKNFASCDRTAEGAWVKGTPR